MALTDFITQVARDADPARAGYQASAVYVTICIVVPVALGLVGALIGYAVDKLAWHGKKTDLVT